MALKCEHTQFDGLVLWLRCGNELETVQIEAAAFVVDEFDSVLTGCQHEQDRLVFYDRIDFLEIIGHAAPAAGAGEFEGAVTLAIDFDDSLDTFKNVTAGLELKEIETVLRDGDVPCEAVPV